MKMFARKTMLAGGGLLAIALAAPAGAVEFTDFNGVAGPLSQNPRVAIAPTGTTFVVFDQTQVGSNVSSLAQGNNLLGNGEHFDAMPGISQVVLNIRTPKNTDYGFNDTPAPHGRFQYVTVLGGTADPHSYASACGLDSRGPFICWSEEVRLPASRASVATIWRWWARRRRGTRTPWRS